MFLESFSGLNIGDVWDFLNDFLSALRLEIRDFFEGGVKSFYDFFRALLEVFKHLIKNRKEKLKIIIMTPKNQEI